MLRAGGGRTPGCAGDGSWPGVAPPSISSQNMARRRLAERLTLSEGHWNFLFAIASLAGFCIFLRKGCFSTSAAEGRLAGSTVNNFTCA